MTFKPNDRVFIPDRYQRPIIQIHRVAKVFKNGNFTLVGSNQQYRPNYNGTSANATGDGGRKAYVQLLTIDELKGLKRDRATYKLAIRRADAYRKLEQLQRSSVISEDYVAALEEAVKKGTDV